MQKIEFVSNELIHNFTNESGFWLSNFHSLICHIHNFGLGINQYNILCFLSFVKVYNLNNRMNPIKEFLLISCIITADVLQGIISIP